MNKTIDYATINYDELARIITKAGIILLQNGAETHRVEDTMMRLAKAYGATSCDAYATPTLLIVSFKVDRKYNDRLLHNIKRVHMQATNLDKIEKVNALSRMVVHSPIDIDELEQRLDTIDQAKGYGLTIRLLAAFICCFAFGLFYKGTLLDASVAALIGVVVETTVSLVSTISFSSFFTNMFASFLATILAHGASMVVPVDSDIVIISAIMLLVPGLAMTNAIRDSVSGDPVSGMTRLWEALIVAIAIAAGSGIALVLIQKVIV